jgi:hypothetical protein
LYSGSVWEVEISTEKVVFRNILDSWPVCKNMLEKTFFFPSK